jgi:hypothetical protein
LKHGLATRKKQSRNLFNSASAHCWIIQHLTVLGIVVQGDGGLLFALALTVLACSLVTLILHRRHIPCISSLFLETMRKRISPSREITPD